MPKRRGFYCSQLVYKAYQQVGIDLNTGLAMEQLPGTNAIIYPQEIWAGCAHRQIISERDLQPISNLPLTIRVSGEFVVFDRKI